MDEPVKNECPHPASAEVASLAEENAAFAWTHAESHILALRWGKDDINVLTQRINAFIEKEIREGAAHGEVPRTREAVYGWGVYMGLEPSIYPEMGGVPHWVIDQWRHEGKVSQADRWENWVPEWS